MTPSQYIAALEPDRRRLISAVRNMLLEHDKNITETVGEMMGATMLIYNYGPVFKYALASPKGHLSFHSMVMYGCPSIREKYIALLPKAKFQKGCINFKNADQMPLAIVEQLIKDSAREAYPPTWYLERLEKQKPSKQKPSDQTPKRRKKQ